MSRGHRPHIVRAGRDATIKKLAAASNADAERMRREAAERAAGSQPVPVVIGRQKKGGAA